MRLTENKCKHHKHLFHDYSMSKIYTDSYILHRFGLLCLMLLSTIFSHIMAVSCVCVCRKLEYSTKPPTYRKSVTNFIT